VCDLRLLCEWRAYPYETVEYNTNEYAGCMKRTSRWNSPRVRSNYGKMLAMHDAIYACRILQWIWMPLIAFDIPISVLLHMDDMLRDGSGNHAYRTPHRIGLTWY
jgi:hypothetical protein